MIKEIKSLSFG